MELRELECLLVLGEELHFGRTGDRLGISQGRVSQLVRSLERQVGGRLFDRTSRSVRPTPLGERLLDEVRPAYTALHCAFDNARAAARGITGELRVGFLTGTAREGVVEAAGIFEARHPDCTVTFVEIPMADPFGALRRGEVEAVVTLLPVAEPDLVVGPSFAKEQQAVALAARHPAARRSRLHAEDLADLPVLDIDGPAPAYWREHMSPTATPDGRPIPRGPAVSGLQEALITIAAGRGGLVFCIPTGRLFARSDITYVPVDGLPDSLLGLVWRRGETSPRLRAFADLMSARF
ncbi:LysR family transcriptional regulator [Actinomadura rupiterrae]|uniref:LysR family transcriptional regulator n=1 Tax=Actinomadura rupiterrae TaxID=559627 RepID=UPI0020A60720|nr:LysR family transcriptional regulator [Actinomadura rupiterrae]MCP2340216.1 DNA-binding transcriptional LysR family regulator [Actinomadura rupiterrae]